MTCNSCGCNCTCHVGRVARTPTSKPKIPFEGCSTSRAEYVPHKCCPAKPVMPPASNLSPGGERYLSTTSRETYKPHPISPQLLETKSPINVSPKRSLPFNGASTLHSDFPAYDSTIYSSPSSKPKDRARVSNIAPPSSERIFETENSKYSPPSISAYPKPSPPRVSSAKKSLPFQGQSESRSQYQPIALDKKSRQDEDYSKRIRQSSITLKETSSPDLFTTSRTTYVPHPSDIYKQSLSSPQPLRSPVRKTPKFEGKTSYRDQYKSGKIVPEPKVKVDKTRSSIDLGEVYGPMETELRGSFKPPSPSDYKMNDHPVTSRSKPKPKIAFEGVSETKREFSPKKAAPVSGLCDVDMRNSSIRFDYNDSGLLETESSKYKAPDSEFYRSQFEQFMSSKAKSSPKKTLPFSGKPTSSDFQPPSPEMLKESLSTNEIARNTRLMGNRGSLADSVGNKRDFYKSSDDYKDFTANRCCNCVHFCEHSM
ncbi:hypothetical protein P9112_012307 [Eukaryota sp. TZLM1-RC]